MFYAGKFKNYFGGTVYGIPDDCIEITRDKPDSQTPTEIAELFCRSKFFTVSKTRRLFSKRSFAIVLLFLCRMISFQSL